MANYSLIHNRISKGRGKAAQRVGQIFSVTRLTSYGFNEIYPEIYCLLRKLRGSAELEQRINVYNTFELVCDVRSLAVGDLLEERANTLHAQPRYTTTVQDKDVDISTIGSVAQSWAPVYLLAQLRPIHKFIGIRLETFCQVRRGLFPDVNGAGGYQEQGENAETALVLPIASGIFTYANVKTVDLFLNPIALIPFQLEPALMRGHPEFNLPMDWLINKWVYACPGNWQGLRLQENDTIIHPDGRRFLIQSVFESHIGPEIIQGVAEKLES